jgi:hypothetical protein
MKMMMVNYRQTQLVYIIYFVPSTYLYPIRSSSGSFPQTVTAESTFVQGFQLFINNIAIQRI